MTDDVRLRAVDDADLEAFLAAEHDPVTVERSKFPAREREAFMNHWRTRILGEETVLARTVTVDGATAGHVVAWWDGDRRFVGYVFDRAFWGRGVGTRALSLFLDEERTRPLYADPYAGNVASVRVLEKCGFQRAGTVLYGEHEHAMFVLGDVAVSPGDREGSRAPPG